MEPLFSPFVPDAGRRTWVKFCGLVRPADVDAAVSLGVDAIGFVFYPRSPRFVDAEAAAALRRRLPSSVRAVGLFVNEAPEVVAAIDRQVGLDVFQFHGDESPAAIAEVMQHLATPTSAAPAPAGDEAEGRRRVWWKALRIGVAGAGGAADGDDAALRQGRVPADAGALDTAMAMFDGADRLLLDSASVGFGGSGHRFDWQLLSPAQAGRIILSGGLDAESVGAALRLLRPWGVDISSGIQGSGPREKDVGRMERFLTAVLEGERDTLRP